MFGTPYLFTLSQYTLPPSVFIFFFLAGSIKLALAPFHIWLGKVHTESTTLGSVLLAALSLKTGYYLHLTLLSNTAQTLFLSTHWLADHGLLLFTLGTWLCGLVLFVQVDSKR